MPSKRKKAVMKAMEEHLCRDKLNYEVSPGGFIRLFMQRDNACYHCILDYEDKVNAVRCLIMGYLGAGKANDAELDKALLHAQTRTAGLRFLRDLDSGDIFADSHILLDKAPPTYMQYEHSFRMLLYAADAFYPVFQRILCAGITAEKSFQVFDAEMDAEDKSENSDAKTAGPVDHAARFSLLDGATNN